jgi:NhaP-type Na+/H+ or K+/H+ antiporter
MRHSDNKRRPTVLWILLGIAVGFNLLVYFRPELTGNDQVNGLGGIFLGLFIAAFPAANFLNMLLFELGEGRWRNLRQADLPWAVLNLAVLLAGLVVVVVGAKLFFAHLDFLAAVNSRN